MIEAETAIWSVLAVQIVGGVALRIFSPRFRAEANGLLGLAAAEVLIPVSIFAVAAFGFWLKPPTPSPDALGAHPVWFALASIPLSLLLLAAAFIIIVKVIIQLALAGVRKLEHKTEDNISLHGTRGDARP